MATENKEERKQKQKARPKAPAYKKQIRAIEKMTQNHFDMWFKAMDEDVKRLCAIRNRPAAQGKRKRSAKQTEEPAKKKKKAKTSTKPERKKKPSAKAKEPEKARVYVP